MAAKTTASKTTAKKAVAKKAAPSKSAAKKTTASKPKVKVIQSIDRSLGHDTTVYFTDGTRAVIKAGNKLAEILADPDFVSPNMVQVTMSGKNIVDAEKVVLDTTNESE